MPTRYNEPTLILNRFFGIWNKGQTKTRPTGSLETAENVNLNGFDPEGGALSIEGREGFTLEQSFTNIQGVYSTKDENNLYIVDDGTLKYVNDDFTTIDIVSGFNGDPVYFTEVGNQIFYSSNIKGIIKEKISYSYIPTPLTPNVSSISGGTLPAGRYLISTTYTREDGAEGGSSVSKVVDISEDGSSLLIEAVAEAGYDVNVYVSSTNGSDLYWIYTGPTANIEWDDIPSLSYPLDREQYQKEPLPDNCTIIEYHEGRIWAVDYSLDDDITAVRFSSPFWWHLYDCYCDYIPVPGEVLVLKSTPEGLIIGTNREIYIYTREETLVKLANYGVISGWPADTLENGSVILWTKRGVCVAPPFQNLTENKVSLPPGTSCSVSLVRDEGEERFVVLNNGNGEADNLY